MAIKLHRQPLYWLLAAIPVAIGLRLSGTAAIWVFIASAVAIVPLAGLMGRATENLAETMGAGIGGLLNATFGNAAELIIALTALRQGPHMYPLVKASLTGSIIGNVLLVLGASMVAGGAYHTRQVFNRTAAGMGATLLALATIGLIVPTLFYYVFTASFEGDTARPGDVTLISEEIAGILDVVYVMSLVFSLCTHRHLFAGEDSAAPSSSAHVEPEWGRAMSILVLLTATVGIALMSEFLVGSVEQAAHALGLTSVFVGVIVVAVIGNAAEHSTAIMVAMKNKMDLSMNIAVGSGLQIALLVAPVLVFCSMFMGHGQPLDLHFTPMEIIAVIISVVVLAMVSQDGECHWFEGVMLLAVYAILALAFFYLPETQPAAQAAANAQ